MKSTNKSYKTFLSDKRISFESCGFDMAQNKLNPVLFDWQRACVQWALKKGRSALFEGTGLGKTIQFLDWSRIICEKTKGDVLILAPLAVASQTKREGKKFGIDVNLCRSQNDIQKGINITNYQRLHLFDPSIFTGIVLDECFPPDTPIDVFNIDNSLTYKYIKDINIGDKIFNAKGIDYVQNIYKRPINRAIQINTKKGQFTCSENHPFFTMHGWKPAKNIQTEDCLMATKEAMRLVRSDFSTKIYSKQDGEVLRSILLGEMANEYSRAQSESSQSNSCGQKRKEKIRMVSEGQSRGAQGIRKSSQYESDSTIYKKNDSNQNKKWNTQTMEREERRKWSRPNYTSANYIRYFIRRLEIGICNFLRQKTKRISYLLQSRYRKSRFKNSDRNRRPWPCKQKKKNIRREENEETKFIRVESVTILEQGHPDLEKYRDADGIIYFYDIEAKQHPSFSVNKCLVHNSGILKNFSGKIRTELIDMFASTPYKLCCTATPSPNDYTELGNTAEFLGVMTYNEMLSMFFINDTGDTTANWRLKGHVADNVFWEWLSSWGMMIHRPEDIGFNGDNFILPELRIHHHVISGKASKHGYFFVQQAKTLSERREARKQSLKKRIEITKELVASTDDIWLIWCDLNIESDNLKRAINNCVEIKGSDDNDYKERSMTDFSFGRIKCLATKPSIAGHGMNWQVCNNMVFCGLSDSFERYYQAIRRCWRFGQDKPVDVHLVYSEEEKATIDNIRRKEDEMIAMNKNMIGHMQTLMQNELESTNRRSTPYSPKIRMKLPEFLTENV